MTNIKRKQSRTCIAAIKNRRGSITIAADRRASWDFSQAQQMPRPKLTKRNGLILAGTGDGYLCTLIVDLLDIPDNEVSDPDTYIHEVLHTKIFKLLKRKGFVDKDMVLRLPEDTSAEILIAIQGRLYSILIMNPDPHRDALHGLIAIDELNLPYASGCGGHLAWGSLLTTENLGMTTKERLTIALQVAATVSPGCDSNIDIESE